MQEDFDSSLMGYRISKATSQYSIHIQHRAGEHDAGNQHLAAGFQRPNFFFGEG